MASLSMARDIEIEDLYRLDALSDPQVSPDGGWVAYVSTRADRDADDSRSTIWMVNWDGSQRVALTTPAEGIDKPRWSPDGRYLAYRSAPENSDQNRLMLLDRRGGEPKVLLSETADIADYAWSPDGAHIALTIERGEDTATHPRPIVIDALHFKQDHDGYLSTDVRSHLYLFDMTRRALQPLTDDPAFNESSPAWSPDGRHLAFIRERERGGDADGRADLDVIDIERGQPVTLARPFAPNSQHLAWSSDGTQVLFLQGREPKLNAYMQDRLFAVAAGRGEPRDLSGALDRAVMSYAVNAAQIHIAVEDDGSVYPALVDLQGSIAPGPRGAFSISELASAGGHTAFMRNDDTAFAEVWVLEDGRMRRLTHHNDALLAELRLATVEEVHFKSQGHRDIHGLLYRPPGFVSGQRYPLLLWIHGGPNGQDQHALSIDGYEFEPQIFAAQGYLVLRVNYRGSAGRGQGFAKAIAADWGHKEVQDLLAGVDYVVAQGLADKERLAIGGWSYGGLLTDYTIASDRRFKAAISGAGSGNQLSTYGADQYVLQYNHEIGPPWVDTALWLKLSYPFFHADRIRTPTLFLGGERDFNVPVIGGEQMYQALRTLSVPARLVVYPGEHHVFSRPSFVVDLEKRMATWLSTYVPPAALKNAAPP